MRPLKCQILFDIQPFFHFQDKHQTAVAKFRDALAHDFQQLEALFNISLQYRKLGKDMAEIQTLKLLKQVINHIHCYKTVGYKAIFSSVPKLIRVHSGFALVRLAVKKLSHFFQPNLTCSQTFSHRLHHLHVSTSSVDDLNGLTLALSVWHHRM